MTKPRRLSETLSVSAQVEPGEVQSLAGAGFRSIISNRPDGEDPGQPTWAEIAAAAMAAGMQARHIPVTPGTIGDDDVARFSAALDELPGPVLAFCRTGGRAASLWALSKAGTLTPDQIIGTAAEAGCDLSQLRDRLTRS
jgi:sulfide:quinone oxidoreductase